MMNGFLQRQLVTLGCLSCGDDSQQLVEDLAELGPLPRRCDRCGGSVLATDSSVRWILDPAQRFNWAADAPKIGRPPKRRAVA